MGGWGRDVARAGDLRGRGGELGHGLGALGHGVLGKLTGEEQADGRLDLAGREGALLVVAGQAGGLKGEALEDVVDERVQDGHAALGDARVGVHLLEHLVDVGAVFGVGRGERWRLGLANSNVLDVVRREAVWSMFVRWADASEESASLPL